MCVSIILLPLLGVMSSMINELVQFRHMRFVLCLLFIMPLGCVKRTLSITSSPPNALVWVNDREVGRTPLEIDFLYYGNYDVRIEHSQTESVMTSRNINAPWWDAPFVDIAAEVLPVELNSTPSWHFDLQVRNDNLEKLVGRANDFRSLRSGEE